MGTLDKHDADGHDVKPLHCYTKHDCRCEDCRAGMAKWKRDRRHSLTRAGGSFDHGTTRGATVGCTCLKCRDVRVLANALRGRF